MTAAAHTHDTTRVIVCSHVVDGGLPVLQVMHEPDGEWQFLCGGTDHVSADQVRFACWTCMKEQDPSLASVNDLWLGYMVTRRTLADRWSVQPCDEVEQ